MKVIGTTIAIKGSARCTAGDQFTHEEIKTMQTTLLNLYIRMQNLKSRLTEDEGQDLVEYALVVALIALAATAGMSTLASDINSAFSGIGTTLSTSL